MPLCPSKSASPAASLLLLMASSSSDCSGLHPGVLLDCPLSLIPHIQTIRISSWHDHKTDPEFDLSSLLPLLQLWSVSPLSLTWTTAITSYEITLVPPPLYHLFTKQPECSFQTSRQSCYSSTQQKTCPSPWLPLSKYKSYYDGL